MDVLDRGDMGEILSSLPLEWQTDVVPAPHAMPVIILDDDPTGTQTVHDVPVLTTWESDVLATILAKKEPVTFLSTNSRALTAEDARQQFDEIIDNLIVAIRQTGVKCDIILRSDSTLRGHFPLDVERVQDGLRRAGCTQRRRVLLVPAFPGGGRYTVNGVQWVRLGQQLLPVGQTPYAQDATFGFKSSDIRQWVEEKSEKKISAEVVGLVTIDMIRCGGPAGVARYLRQAPAFTVVDAASDADLTTVVQGLSLAEDENNRFLVRSAASFVRARTGMSERPLLTRKEMGVKEGAGLVVVGSHVSTTTRQVERLVAGATLVTIQIAVRRLLQEPQSEIARLAAEIDANLASRKSVMVITERDLVTGSSADESLRLAAEVSLHLSAMIGSLTQTPAFLVAKGGITSADVATKGLGLRRGYVLGQVIPGVPVWRIDDADHFHHVPYIVFPGNVGDENALLTVYRILSSRE